LVTFNSLLIRDWLKIQIWQVMEIITSYVVKFSRQNFQVDTSVCA
jgi:hypothetical protein